MICSRPKNKTQISWFVANSAHKDKYNGSNINHGCFLPPSVSETHPSLKALIGFHPRSSTLCHFASSFFALFEHINILLHPSRYFIEQFLGNFVNRTQNTTTQTTINHDAPVDTPIVGGSYEATIPPTWSYGGFIVSQQPNLHDGGGVWHEVPGKGLKCASGTTTHVVFPLAQDAC